MSGTPPGQAGHTAVASPWAQAHAAAQEVLQAEGQGQGQGQSLIPRDAAPHDDPLARPALKDWDPSGSADESDAAFTDFQLSQGNAATNHMDPIYEESERTSITLAELAEVEAAAARTARRTSSQAGDPGGSPAHADPHNAWLLHDQRHSANSQVPGVEGAEGSEGAAAPRSSAPSASSPTASASGGGGERKKPLLQRISASFKSPAAAVLALGAGAGAGADQGAERSSLMQKMGSALSRMSASFKPSGDSPSPSPREGAGADAPHSAEEGNGRTRSRGDRENRPLGASSVPVGPAYTQDAMQGQGRPNLRRRGCYSGLVGSYRMGSVPEGVVAVDPEQADEKQLSELKGWLDDTTQPWQQHSRRLHKMQMEARIQQQELDSKEPKVVLPQAPPKPKLKTFSMAYR